MSRGRVMIPACSYHAARRFLTQAELKVEAAKRVEAGDKQTQCRQCKGWFYEDQITLTAAKPAL